MSLKDVEVLHKPRGMYALFPESQVTNEYFFTPHSSFFCSFSSSRVHFSVALGPFIIIVCVFRKAHGRTRLFFFLNLNVQPEPRTCCLSAVVLFLFAPFFSASYPVFETSRRGWISPSPPDPGGRSSGGGNRGAIDVYRVEF